MRKTLLLLVVLVTALGTLAPLAAASEIYPEGTYDLRAYARPVGNDRIRANNGIDVYLNNVFPWPNGQAAAEFAFFDRTVSGQTLGYTTLLPGETFRGFGVAVTLVSAKVDAVTPPPDTPTLRVHIARTQVAGLAAPTPVPTAAPSSCIAGDGLCSRADDACCVQGYTCRLVGSFRQSLRCSPPVEPGGICAQYTAPNRDPCTTGYSCQPDLSIYSFNYICKRPFSLDFEQKSEHVGTHIAALGGRQLQTTDGALLGAGATGASVLDPKGRPLFGIAYAKPGDEFDYLGYYVKYEGYLATSYITETGRDPAGLTARSLWTFRPSTYKPLPPVDAWCTDPRYIEDPQASAGEVRALAHDPAGFLYVGTKSGWRIKKINLQTGAVVWSTAAGAEFVNTALYALVHDAPRNALYVVGEGPTLRKLDSRTGELVTAWKYALPVTDPGGHPFGAAVDADGNLYIAGSFNDVNLQGNSQWRVEKISGQTAERMWQYLLNPSVYSEFAKSVVVDPAGFVYVSGVDSTDGRLAYKWRIHKLRADNGAVVWEYLDNPDGQYGIPYQLGLDKSGNLYAAGHSGTVKITNFRPHIQKLNAQSGQAVWKKRGSDEIGAYLALTLDAQGAPYATGFLIAPESEIAALGTEVRDFQWRTDKFNTADGSSSWTRLNNPGPGIDFPNAIVAEPSGFLYVGGSSSTPFGGPARIEKLEASSGRNVLTPACNLAGAITPAATPTPTPGPTPTVVITPTPTPTATITALACTARGTSCCQGESCQAVAVDCLKGYVPKFNGCSESCTPQWTCERTAATPTPLPVCPQVYQPVCGKDGKTYSSACEMQRAGTSLDYTGECKPLSAACESKGGECLPAGTGEARGCKPVAVPAYCGLLQPTTTSADEIPGIPVERSCYTCPPPLEKLSIPVLSGWNLVAVPVGGSSARMTRNWCETLKIWHYDPATRQYVAVNTPRDLPRTKRPGSPA